MHAPEKALDNAKADESTWIYTEREDGVGFDPAVHCSTSTELGVEAE
jgi:hypothetical protein